MRRAVRICAPLLALALAGCARDVVIKPAVIAFNAQAKAATGAAEKQYDDTIARLNAQTADFLARNPECGLATDIVPRRRNAGAAPRGPYCLSEAEKAALPGAIATERLPIASRATFAPQFRALDVLLDYVGFLAIRAGDPKLTAQAEIQSIAATATGLGQGIADLRSALGGGPPGGILAEFMPGGAVDKFAGALGELAGQFELIARQANDVAALERAIKTARPAVDAAIETLALNADAWSCAALERRQVDANRYALDWTPRLASLPLEERLAVTRGWLERAQFSLPTYCPAAGRAPVGRGQVASMLLAVRAANDELVDIANHDYTPEQRRAIAEATLSRLSGLLSRFAALVPVLP